VTGCLYLYFFFFRATLPKARNFGKQKLHCMALGGVGVLGFDLGALLQGQIADSDVYYHIIYTALALLSFSRKRMNDA